VSPSPEADGGV
jgi:hypothetical protein